MRVRDPEFIEDYLLQVILGIIVAHYHDPLLLFLRDDLLLTQKHVVHEALRGILVFNEVLTIYEELVV